MKKPDRKVIAIAVVLLTILLLAGCTQPSTTVPTATSAPTAATAQTTAAPTTPEPNDEPTGVVYPIPGDVHLSLATGEQSQVTTNAESLAATPFGQAWQQATGVTLEIIHPATNDAFNLLFASGEYPDIISYNFVSYPGGPVKAIEDKIIFPINDLLEDNAPDLNRVLQSNDNYRKSVTTTNGNIIGFPFIRGDELLLTSAGLIIRQDWLDDLDMDLPATADDLYNVLKAFKEQKGATVPFSLSDAFWLQTISLGHGLITSPFGLAKTDFFVDNGTVYYGYYQLEYRDVLTYLNTLYSEGLLDPNYTTLDGNTQNANIMNGSSGVTVSSLCGGLGNYLQTMESKDSTYDLSGFGPLVAKKGDIPMSTHYDNPVTGLMSVITTSCENKEAAAQFLNYGYTDDGYTLFNFGVEGESYTMIDGKPVYTEFITDNPDGWTMQQALAQYTRSWSGDSFVQDREYYLQYAGKPQQQAALASWSNTDASKYKMPPVTIAEADSDEYSRLMGDISTYISEMTTKFITGVEPLSKFDTDYLPTLKQMGIEQAIAIQQAAYDEFEAK